MGKLSLLNITHEVVDVGARVIDVAREGAQVRRFRLEMRAERLLAVYPWNHKATAPHRAGIAVCRAIERACDRAVVGLFNLELLAQRHA